MMLTRCFARSVQQVRVATSSEQVARSVATQQTEFAAVMMPTHPHAVEPEHRAGDIPVCNQGIQPESGGPRRLG